jgi:hypothetical protein
VALAYFTTARIYAAVTSRALETSVVRASVDHDAKLQGVLLLLELHADPGERALRQMRRRLRRVGTERKSVEALKGRQEGIWALFENVLLVSWAAPAGDRDARSRIDDDIAAVTAVVNRTLRGRQDTETGAIKGVIQEGPISGGEAAKADWRALFAEAQLRWQQAAQRPEGPRS